MRSLLLLWASLLPAQCRLEIDLDGDRRTEVLRLRPFHAEQPDRGALIVEKSGGPALTIDPDLTTRECHVMNILGRRGVVVLPHGMQVRFYTIPDKLEGAWAARDIYSFYTASWQGGLLQVDVDQDGLLDLICGNYWIKSPTHFGLPWRLFAINAFHEHPLSASAQLHWDGQRLLWVESRRPKGRVIWFRPPTDPKQLWLGEAHPQSEKLDCPQIVQAGGELKISASMHRCR
ncbi:MAG: hypothetical protein OHK0021_20630 [Bryobacter sp.]